MKYSAIRMAIILASVSAPAVADCFDEAFVVSRYHYPNPGTVGVNYQDLYILDFPALPQTLPVVTRLSNGFNAANRYDSTDAVFSTDGVRVAFVSSRDQAGTDVYVMDSADGDGDGQGDSLVRVTNDNAERFGLFWGAGNRLLYVSEAASYQIVTAILNPNGTLGTETTLTAHSSETSPPAMASGGNHIVYPLEKTPFPNRTHSLNHVSIAGGQVTELLFDGVVNQSPSVHPVSGAVFFASSRSGGKLDIFKVDVNFSTNPPTVGMLSNVTQTNDISESDVKVSPDGKCIAYLGSDLSIGYGPNSDLYITDIAAQVTKRVTSTRDLGSFDWAPTGYSFASTETEAPAQSDALNAVPCKTFEADNIKVSNVNGTRVYLHSGKVAAGSSGLERCTKAFPPFTDCALTQFNSAGSASACEVKPAKGIVNSGRWKLNMENASSSETLECTMSCQTR